MTRRVVVSFSIGEKYHDEIVCDILPMCASHILLGRPWLFDRRMLHDGFRNTYVFQKDGKRIVLSHMMSTEVQNVQKKLSKVVKKKALITRRKGVEEIIQAEEPLYVLQARYLLEVVGHEQVPTAVK